MKNRAYDVFLKGKCIDTVFAQYSEKNEKRTSRNNETFAYQP
jgi:hypothetical protein